MADLSLVRPQPGAGPLARFESLGATLLCNGLLEADADRQAAAVLDRKVNKGEALAQLLPDREGRPVRSPRPPRLLAGRSGW
jgi:hypothetical protein